MKIHAHNNIILLKGVKGTFNNKSHEKNIVIY